MQEGKIPSSLLNQPPWDEHILSFPLKGKPGRCLKGKGKTGYKLLPSPHGVSIQPWQPGHVPMVV